MKRIGRIPQLTTKAKILLGVAIVVVVGAVLTLIGTSYLAGQLRSGGETYDFKDADASTRKKDAIKAAQSATDSGNSDKAEAIYEQAIKDEPDANKKVQLAISHSRMLKLSGKIDEAIAVAKKAESYDKDTFLISDWLAQLYESDKRYEDAAKYYTLAGTMASSPTNVGKYSKAFYTSEAARVSGLAKKS